MPSVCSNRSSSPIRDCGFDISLPIRTENDDRGTTEVTRKKSNTTVRHRQSHRRENYHLPSLPVLLERDGESSSSNAPSSLLSTSLRHLSAPPTQVDEQAELRALILRATRSRFDRNHLLSLRGKSAENALRLIFEVSSERSFEVINLTSHQMLDISNSSPKYRAKRFDLRRLLIKLSKTAEIIPSGLFLDHVLCDDRETLQIGGYADIFRGTVHGRAIALKRLRVSMVLQQNRKYIQVRSSGLGRPIQSH